MVAFSSQSVLASLLMGLVFQISTAQLDDGSCACQPLAFELVLDFSSRCGDSDFNDESPGIEEYICSVEPPDKEDLSPVKASLITIAEVDENYQVLYQYDYPGDFEQGDSFSFNSSIAGGMSVIPRGLTVTVIGEGPNGTEIINLWAMLFSDDCDDYPIIQDGNKAGWTTFVSIIYALLTHVGPPKSHH
jgi:hypothetical protein